MYDQTGALLRELPINYQSSLDLRSVGSGTDVVIVEFFSGAVALDLATDDVVWNRLPLESEFNTFQVFGLIDGRVHGVATGFETMDTGDFEDLPTEVFVAATDEVRCVLSDRVFATRHVLYGHGTMCDLDCEPIWKLPEEPDASTYLVDEAISSTVLGQFQRRREASVTTTPAATRIAASQSPV